MRTLVVAVPPTTAAKLSAVVRFALEEQLAGDVESQHVVIAAQRERDALVHVVDKRWLKEALAALARQGIRPVAVVAESDLAPRPQQQPQSPGVSRLAGTWIWREDGGFLIEAGGRVAVLDQSQDALPSGLLLALRNSVGADGGNAAGSVRTAVAASPRVVVHGPSILREQSPAWSRATGVIFDIQPEWTWRDASATSIAAAANLLTPALDPDDPAMRPAASRPRTARIVLWWLAAALLLHAGASAAEWVLLKWRGAKVERDTQQLIRAAAPELTGDLDPAWRKYYAAARHRQGKTAPDDALPLLAETAGALTELPPGALRVITFEAGQLTLDFDRSATVALAAALPLWQSRGLTVLQAETPGGLRLRIARP
jgi:type II secretion system protein L